MKKSDKRLIMSLYAIAFFTLFFGLGIISGAMLGLIALGIVVPGVFLFERGDVRPWLMITASSVGFASGVCVVVIWIGDMTVPTVVSWAAGVVALFHFLVWIGFRREKHIPQNSEGCDVNKHDEKVEFSTAELKKIVDWSLLIGVFTFLAALFLNEFFFQGYSQIVRTTIFTIGILPFGLAMLAIMNLQDRRKSK